ncbi:hypothetical protein [Trichlorobacter lovleyi]|uniref:hypothetical protein n=1 Tax=Trichlorobacter lovleyi TaxID=313985 RepID=UPI0023F2F6AD|nr:hypothetical protein [Trichlorobacter lovleyi]
MSHSWSSSFRAIPQSIRIGLEAIPTNYIIVGCVKKIPRSAIAEDKFSHLGITMVGGQLSFPTEIVPPPENGKSSSINFEGQEIVRKDLPKVSKAFPVETPNFGDWSKGSHTIYWKRQVYLRQNISPKLREITLELIGEEPGADPNFAIKFVVNEVLDKTSNSFESDLFDVLNLLQENVGAVAVFKSDASLADFLQTIHLTWDILPPGEGERNVTRILSGIRNRSEGLERTIRERYTFLSQLRPVAFINGRSGFQRYFGAKFSDNLVVFENISYGNAIYIMYEDWEALSQRSRSDLLTADNLRFDRVVHGNDWKEKVSALVRGKRRGKF